MTTATNPSSAADPMRARAAALRAVAAAIDAVPMATLAGRAGPDTWRSRVADECRAELAADHHRLLAAADDLRTTAWILDRRAAELDLAARLAALR